MKSLKRQPHVLTYINQTTVKIRVHNIAQSGVTAITTPQRLDRTVVFSNQGFMILIGSQKFIFKTSHRKQPHILCTFKHFTQNPAWTNAFQTPHQLTLHPQHIVFQRHFTRGLWQNPYHRIGITVFPAGQCRVVVQTVAHIPAKQNVAKTETAIQRRKKFVARHVLTGHDTVDIHHTHLDLTHVAFDHQLLQFVCTVYF